MEYDKESSRTIKIAIHPQALTLAVTNINHIR
jgi:hypothetical protein